MMLELYSEYETITLATLRPLQCPAPRLELKLTKGPPICRSAVS